uniref:BlaI/MecI/CopY family transcriptional regulator n=1 Tax=Anaerobutyricum hallii TaxID=39488 RepID=UPI003FEE0D92
MKEKIRLTKSEREIMNVLWDTREALTSSEIIKYSVNKTWKDTSVHLLLKTLLDKNIIEVAGFKKTTRNYARKFRATMSQYDYFFQEDFQNVDLKRKIQFMKIIIQNASLEELEEINNVISQISNRINK